MAKARIFVYIHYLEIGGAERALIGLLNALDPGKVDIDLFLNQHTGEFVELIPPHVNLLPELPEYSAIERPISQIAKEGHLGIALRRMVAKYKHGRHIKSLPENTVKIDNSIYQYIFRAVTPALRDLSHLGEYDLAISFLQPHNIVLNKVKAKKKMCWIHTDYSTVYVNKEIELPVWSAYDYIAGISDEAVRAFGNVFPEVRDKLITVENILSASAIHRQADMEEVTSEMPERQDEIKILSIGRFCAAKRFEIIPGICRHLIDKGVRLTWYILGFGDDTSTRQNIAKYGVEDRVVLLGKKANPYPYIKACDIYAQPSLYEGKSVTVREAQILCKPVVISDYPTAKSQITDGVDGRIVPLDEGRCAEGIYQFVRDKELQKRITHYLREHDYGNESEVEKIYAKMAATE